MKEKRFEKVVERGDYEVSPFLIFGSIFFLMSIGRTLWEHSFSKSYPLFLVSIVFLIIELIIWLLDRKVTWREIK